MEKKNEEEKEFDLKIPPGTPEDIIAAAIEKFKLSKKMTHISTGGGASLMLFEGKKLPAMQALEQNYRRFK